MCDSYPLSGTTTESILYVNWVHQDPLENGSVKAIQGSIRARNHAAK